MEATREALQAQYSKMETQDLIQLSATETLTDLANIVLHEVLESRGISGEKVEEQNKKKLIFCINTILQNDIKGSLTFVPKYLCFQPYLLFQSESYSL